ncbi:MAG: hypothetical protein LBC12_01495 [Nitrososphaerota archaeon]|jgi:hypothetical protein|nr:hypothetical protein [Nitrososphaerota archaeon]
MKPKVYIGLAVLTLLIAFLCILQPIQAQYTADGEPVTYYVDELSIVTPLNTTYTSNRVCLNFTVIAHFDPNVAKVTVVYSLDGKDNVTVPVSSEFVPVGATVTDANGVKSTQPSALYSYYVIAGLADFGELSQGIHNLAVFARYDDQGRNRIYFDDHMIYFTIDENFMGISETRISSAAMARIYWDKIGNNNGEKSANELLQDTVNNEFDDGAEIVESERTQITANNKFDNNKFKFDIPNNAVYAFAGIISVISVVLFALFTKRKTREKL